MVESSQLHNGCLCLSASLSLKIFIKDWKKNFPFGYQNINIGTNSIFLGLQFLHCIFKTNCYLRYIVKGDNLNVLFTKVAKQLKGI